MNLDELIKTRRSIRKFKDTPVKRQDIEACIEAARLAPSACNSQPWQFIVFDDKEAKDKFADSVFTGVYSSCRHLANSPVLIAISAKAGGNISTMLGQIISGTRYYLVDQGIALEHLVLKAWDIGLGTCIIGWFDPKKAKKALNLPFDKKVEILIALGYPDETPAPRPRKELQKLISYNGYK